MASATCDLSPEAVVVLASVVRGQSTALPATIAESTGVSLLQVNAAVDELVASGHLRVDEAGTLRALPPTSRLVATTPIPPERAARERQKWQMATLVPPSARTGLVVPVHGNSAAVAQIAELNLTKPTELLSLSPAPVYQTLTQVDAPARASNFTMLTAGRTTATWVTDSSRLRIPSLRQHVEQLADHGEEVYVAPNVAHRFAIYDRTVAVVPLDPADHLRGCLVVRSPSLIAGLVALFREVIDRATPVPGGRRVSPARRQLLVLLAGGAKDDAIARKLEISPRSVRRAIASMMADCGAESRFQLAVAAVRLGWLTEDDLVGSVVPPG